jgi:hypothetical protein
MSNKTPPTPYEQPKATRAGKPVVNGQVAKETTPETPFQALQWLTGWPKPPMEWTKITDRIHRLKIGSIRLEVFAQNTEHSTKQAWGFGLYGLYGDLHIEPAVSFDMRDAQEAALKCIDWINNNKQGEPPYTCAIPKQPKEEPRPRPRRPGINPPARPGLPHLRLGPPIVVELNDDEDDEMEDLIEQEFYEEYEDDEYEDDEDDEEID